MKFFGLIVAAFYIVLALAGPSFSSSFSGLPITQIAIQDEEGSSWPRPEQLAPLLNVRPGDRYSSDAVRTGLSYLYLKGLFKDVRVEGFPDGSGVRLVYTLIPVTFVDSLVITGNHALSTSKIVEAIPGVEGKALREDKFPEYRAAIAMLYQSEGYYAASVDVRAEKLKTPHRALLHIDIHEPRPTIVSSVTFSGNTALTGRQLLKVIENKPGRPLKGDVLLDADTAAIAEKYDEAGYPVAKAGPVEIAFSGGTAAVGIAVTEGPKVTVRFSGNHAIGDRTLREQVLVWSEHDVSDSIIDSSADKIKNLYRDDGYANVKVEWKKTEAPGRLELAFDVREGQRFTVKKVVIRGNLHFSTKQIKAEMTLLHQFGWFKSLFASNPFREDLLDKDLDYLLDRYTDAGFLQASVKKKVDFPGNGSKAAVAIDIEEGPQTRTGQVSFEGNTAFTGRELLALVSLKTGAPYSERLADDDRYRILSAYSNKGYLYARAEVEKKSTDGVVDIKYKITEDRQVRIGRIILRGNERTKDRVIMRELLVNPGDPYDYGKILASQQRIYHLGYFGQAKFEPIHPGEKEYVKDMLLTVEERPAGAVEVGGGYGDVDHARGFVQVSYRNLWGRAESASVRAEESGIVKRAVFNYHQPWVLGYDVEGNFGLEWSNLKRLNQDTREIFYQTRRTAVSYGVEKKLDGLKPSLTYQFENVDNHEVLPQAVLSPEDIGRVRVSSLTPALVWDLRDDIFNPHKGSLHGIALKEALSALGSQADFSKLTVQSSWYVPVGSGIIAAMSARGGMTWTHRDTLDVPLHERFYLGGSTTVRGFTQDSVGPSSIGPDGQPIPLGGASMAVFNAELRLSLTEGFGIVLFSDAGNVWTGHEIRLDDLRASYGAGIRYGTPVGPLRIDYGQKIHRRPGESPGELHFNIGHTF
jgi:outer membrane protein insertion porin family